MRGDGLKMIAYLTAAQRIRQGLLPEDNGLKHRARGGDRRIGIGPLCRVVDVSAPCSNVDDSDSCVSVNVHLITKSRGVPARGPLTRVPR